MINGAEPSDVPDGSRVYTDLSQCQYPDRKKRGFPKKTGEAPDCPDSNGDYDCVIVGHTQFQRIPISEERQKEMMEKQVEQLMIAIDMAKQEEAQKLVRKTDGNQKKQLLDKIKRMNNEEIKDHVVCFEELWCQCAFCRRSAYF